MMLLGEWTTQIVEIAKSTVRGNRGLMASRNVRILPVLSLYDLEIAKYILLRENLMIEKSELLQFNWTDLYMFQRTTGKLDTIAVT